MNILILKGGNSSEREISLLSASCVTDALNQKGHNVVELDTSTDMENLAKAAQSVDVVLPILHGEDGEDGTIQKHLERLDVPFLGAGSEASKLCFDKVAFKKLVVAAGYKTPAHDTVTKESIIDHTLLQKSYVLKPNAAGSSVATFIVKDPSEPVPMQAFDFAHSMLLEQYIEGIEITVAILEETPLPVVEIIPPSGEFFDYINKYNGKTQDLCPPLHVETKVQKYAQKIALDLHLISGARHLSRTDMIIDKNNNIYVLELNTIPGMTSHSLMPVAARAANLPFADMIEQLAKMAT